MTSRFGKFLTSDRARELMGAATKAAAQENRRRGATVPVEIDGRWALRSPDGVTRYLDIKADRRAAPQTAPGKGHKASTLIGVDLKTATFRLRPDVKPRSAARGSDDSLLSQFRPVGLGPGHRSRG